MYEDELNTSREPVSTPPGPAGDQNRLAYLSLLKLSLCDLAGARTRAIHFDTEGHLFTRDLQDRELKFRVMGVDWPVNALTMVGLERLDDLQECVETLVADGVEGDLIEAGTWRGGSSILMRATLDSLGESERTVWLADSFNGFPAPDEESYPQDNDLDLSKEDFLAVPVSEVRGHFDRFGLDRGLRFVEGYFEDTMPTLTGGSWSLIRLDGDTYESTILSLRSLYPGLARGGFLVIDDFQFLPECRKAVEDFRAEQGIEEPIEQIDWTGARWRKQADATTEPGASPAGAGAGTDESERKIDRQSQLTIPTMMERFLKSEVDNLRERVDPS